LKGKSGQLQKIFNQFQLEYREPQNQLIIHQNFKNVVLKTDEQRKLEEEQKKQKQQEEENKRQKDLEDFFLQILNSRLEFWANASIENEMLTINGSLEIEKSGFQSFTKIFIQHLKTYKGKIKKLWICLNCKRNPPPTANSISELCQGLSFLCKHQGPLSELQELFIDLNLNLDQEQVYDDLNEIKYMFGREFSHIKTRRIQ